MQARGERIRELIGKRSTFDYRKLWALLRCSEGSS